MRASNMSTHKSNQLISEMMIDTALKSISYDSATLPSTTSLSYMILGIHDLHSKRGGCLVCSTSNSSDERGKGGAEGMMNWCWGLGLCCLCCYFSSTLSTFLVAGIRCCC